MAIRRVTSCFVGTGATNVVVDLSKPPPPMPPPRPRVGIDVKSFYDDPTDVDWCRDGVCFVELGAASGHPDFMRRLRGVDGPHGYNPTVQESGTFLFIMRMGNLCDIDDVVFCSQGFPRKFTSLLRRVS